MRNRKQDNKLCKYNLDSGQAQFQTEIEDREYENMQQN